MYHQLLALLPLLVVASAANTGKGQDWEDIKVTLRVAKDVDVSIFDEFFRPDSADSMYESYDVATDKFRNMPEIGGGGDIVLPGLVQSKPAFEDFLSKETDFGERLKSYNQVVDMGDRMSVNFQAKLPGEDAAIMCAIGRKDRHAKLGTNRQTVSEEFAFNANDWKDLPKADLDHFKKSIDGKNGEVTLTCMRTLTDDEIKSLDKPPTDM